MRDLSKALVAVAVGFGLVHSAHGDEPEPTDQPRVVAYGELEGGGLAFCASAQCIVAFDSAEKELYELEMTLEPDEGVDRELFCTLLSDQQPENCDPSDPPSTPGTDSDWQPNGCGTGGASNLLLDSGLSQFYTEHYSGNFNAPFPGVSFLSACDAHDACWGVAGSRATCDTRFHDSMTSNCSVLAQDSSRTVCNGFAAAYFSAVSATDIGDDNYDQSVENRKCALWAYDMMINACE